MHKRLVKARGLTQDDVGKFIGCHDGSVDYPAKIERLQRFESGARPVSPYGRCIRHCVGERPVRNGHMCSSTTRSNSSN